MFGRYVSIDKAADAELLTRVSIALVLLGRSSLRTIQPAVLNGRVTLRGTLPDADDCRLAVEAVRRIPGVLRVIDRLRIRSTSPTATVTALSRLELRRGSMAAAVAATVAAV